MVSLQNYNITLLSFFNNPEDLKRTLSTASRSSQRFRLRQTLSRTKEDVDQLVKKIKSYCVEVKREMSKLDSYSKLPKIDFIKACKMARSIKSRSIWIGAKNVRNGCVFVLNACLDFDEESLSEAVVCLSNEFERTRRRFEEYLEMERKIAEKEKQLGEPNK